MGRMLSILVNIVKQTTISASFEIPIITATQLNSEEYREGFSYGDSEFPFHNCFDNPLQFAIMHLKIIAFQSAYLS